jgi:hypothetical protein
MILDSGKTSATGATGTRRAERGDTRDDYDFCCFLMFFDGFLRADDDANDEMK